MYYRRRYRPRIHTICNCSAHVFPIRMRYVGQHFRRGRRVHVMACPVSGIERHYIRGRAIKRVA